MRWLEKLFRILLWCLTGLMGIYIVYRGFLLGQEPGFVRDKLLPGFYEMLEQTAMEVLAPALLMEEKESRETQNQSQEETAAETETQSETAAETEIKSETETETRMETETQTKTQTETETLTETESLGETEAALEAILPAGKMREYDYLLNHFFTLDTSTVTDETLIDYDTLTGMDLTIEKDASVPQILIYHTHSQEAFVDSVEGDVDTTVVGVGSRLAEILEENYGYNVIHHTAVYDMVDGELDRNQAYDLAEADISKLLETYPQIQVVIDLHRDGVDGQKFVTEINGKPTAMVMFFNGLSRTAMNGPVTYLPNPYIEENLAFSFQMQLRASRDYPGYTRNIYLQSLRYNLHLRPRSLLIECGTQLNTVEEEYNAMEPLADLLNQVLQGEP